MISAKDFGATITRLMNKEDLSRNEAKAMFQEILLNNQTDMHQGAFLASLTAKGETAEEIAAAWEAIYEIDTVKITPVVDSPLVENSGTGMDTFKTFNVSTAACIIAAAAGIKMAKHGARAITSVCGTIDMLEELGVDVECAPEIVQQSIERAGIGIFNGMSAKVHPMALGRVLSQILFGTTLNIAASLANPVLPQYGVRGVYAKELLVPVAEVMREIGYQRALVVHGLAGDGIRGMDEASVIGETYIAELKEGIIEQFSFKPEDVGINTVTDGDVLKPSRDRKQEALRMIKILTGQEQGARFDIVCLNAGLILYLMDVSDNIEAGYQRAKEIARSGAAMEKLKEWVREQNTNPAHGLSKLNSLLSA